MSLKPEQWTTREEYNLGPNIYQQKKLSRPLESHLDELGYRAASTTMPQPVSCLPMWFVVVVEAHLSLGRVRV